MRTSNFVLIVGRNYIFTRRMKMYKIGNLGDRVRCTYAVGPHFTVDKIYTVVAGEYSNANTVIDNNGYRPVIGDSKFILVDGKETKKLKEDDKMKQSDVELTEALKERYQDIKEVYRWYSRDKKVHTKVVLKSGSAGATVLSENDENSIELAIVYALLKARGKAVIKTNKTFSKLHKALKETKNALNKSVKAFRKYRKNNG
jgi:hypothetical protein